MGVVSAAYACSVTWRSERVQEMERWRAATSVMHLFFKEKAPLAPVPWDFCDWIRHRMFVSEANLEFCRKRLKDQIVKGNLSRQRPPLSAFGGKKMRGNRSSVLAQPTIWCEDWFVVDRAGAELWPPQAELKYEGDCRAERNFGRKLPLPRARSLAAVDGKVDDESLNPDRQRFLLRIQQHPLDNIDWIDRARQDWLGFDNGQDEALSESERQQWQAVDAARVRHYLGVSLLSCL